MIRSAMIGLGKMGLSHYAILNRHPLTEVTAICDSSSYAAEIIASRSGAKVFSDYRRMFDACELDAVLISTPSATHTSMAGEAIARGLHVFLEKPMTLSPDDSRSLAAAAEAAGVVNQVGYMNRFCGLFMQAAEMVRSGVLGRVHHFSASMRGNVVTRPSSGGSWRAKKDSGGGCLYEYGSHCIDLVHFFFGRPDRVSGSSLRRVFSPELEDVVVSTLHYDDGPTGQILVDWCDPTFRKAANHMEIHGDRGVLQVGKQDCRLFLREAVGELPAGWTIRYQTDVDKPMFYYLRGVDYSGQLDHFMQCIHDRSLGNRCSFAEAAWTDEIMAEIRRDAGEVR